MPTQPLQAVLRRLHALGSDQVTDRELLERFALQRDEAAFAVIVRRHGRLVHGVCRRLLGNHHDAEDAFQATFLVLARKASSGRWQSSLGGWLYRVAYHMAKKSRESNARRRSREQKAASIGPSAAAPEVGVRDVSALLDDGLEALGTQYREVLIRCCLQDQTREEAARGLGLSQRTLERRLAKGKELLRGWLARRGVTLSATLLAAALSKEASAALADQTASATAQAACAFLVSASKSGASARAVALAQTALKRFTAIKASALILGFVGLCAGGWLARGQLLADNHSVAASPLMADAENQNAQKKTDAPRTDVFGEPLPAGAISRLGSLQMRHGEFTNFVRFTPDGKRLVSHGGDGVRVWDAATGKLLQTFPGDPTGGGYQPSLSADGALLAIPSSTGIRLWDVATGRLIRRLTIEDSFYACLAPDGRSVATSPNRDRKIVTLLSTATGKELWSYSSGGLPWISVDYTSNGHEVLVAGWGNLVSPPHPDNTVRFLDARTGNEVRRIDLGTVAPRAIALSPRGNRLGVLGYFNPDDYLQSDLRVWDIATSKLIAHVTPAVEPGRQRFFSALAFVPDGKSIVTAGSQDELFVWDIASGKERSRLGHGFGNSFDLTFAPDRKSTAVAARFTVRTISWPSGQNLVPDSVPLDNQYWTAVSPDRSKIVTIGHGPTFVTYDLRTGRELHRFTSGKDTWGLAFTRDGSLALSVPFHDKTITVWDGEAGKPVGRFVADWIKGDLGLCSFTPDHKLIALSSWLGDTIYLADWKSGKVARSFRQPGRKICNAEFAAGGQTMFVYCQDHTVHIWDATKVVELRHFGPIGDTRPLTCMAPPRDYSVALSPDGKVLFYYASNTLSRFDGYVAQFFDTTTGNPLSPLIDKPSELPYAICFSPDGRMLACSDERTYQIHLVEVRTGRDRRILSGHRGPVRSLTFSPDGGIVVSASADTTSLVWDLNGRSMENAGRNGRLSASELGTCWNDLSCADAARAYRAIQKLASAPASSVPFLSARLRTDPAAAAPRVERLISDLPSDRFAAREKAVKGLNDLGPIAVRACEKALASRPDAEVRARLEKFLDAHRLPISRAIESLELAGTVEARPLLQFLAEGPAESPVAQDARGTLQRLNQR